MSRRREGAKGPRSAFATIEEGRRFSETNCLMGWDEIADRLSLIEGKRISKGRVWQIAKRAEAKIRAALGSFEDWSA